MDISKIPQQLIKALEQKNTDQLVALSRVLNMILGKTVMASVNTTAPVTPSERAQLLQQTAAALAQLHKQPAANLTPAQKAEVARLLQQQQLIQSPELKWVNLQLNNHPLLTYSDRPLSTGQTIPVQLQTPQKLVLLDLPGTTADVPESETNIPAALTDPPLTFNKKSDAALNDLVKAAVAELIKQIPDGADPQLIKKLVEAQFASPNVSAKTPAASSHAAVSPENEPAQSGKSAMQTNTKSNYAQNVYSPKDLAQKFSGQSDSKLLDADAIATKNILSQSLRNLLQHKDLPDRLFSAVNQIQQLPPASRAQIISPSVAQALKSLAEQIRSPAQLSEPKGLQQTIKNSGLQFENKLGDLAKNTSTLPTHTAVANTFSQDIKGNLLTLFNRVSQELSGQTKPLNSEQTIKLLQNLTSIPSTGFGSPDEDIQSNETQNLDVFIRQLMTKPAKELSNKELRTQLLVLLQQHSLHSLAKIQLQQLHSLNQELESKDSPTPAASWQLEIPVKYHGDVQQLQLRIDREWIDEKKEADSSKGNKKIKQWSVTLRFDLPKLGEFCAQLAITDNNVSATLWAARENTFAQVAAQVDGLRKQLESEGVTVNYLQCMRGMPPEKPMALSYSLIDVST